MVLVPLSTLTACMFTVSPAESRAYVTCEVELPLVSGLRAHCARQRDRSLVVGDQRPVQPAHQPMDRAVPAGSLIGA